MHLKTRSMAARSAALAAALLFISPALTAQTPEQVTINTAAPGTPFPHFWEQMFGSGAGAAG
jgi:xylan 1,4-beta-xylosidase